MSAPRIARCNKCDAPVCIYGPDDEADLTCFSCAEKQERASKPDVPEPYTRAEEKAREHIALCHQGAKP